MPGLIKKEVQPKQELHRFYNRHGKHPAFLVDDTLTKPGHSVCKLICPAIEHEQHPLPEKTFYGTGRKKKEAFAAAAVPWWEWIQAQGLYLAAQPATDLWEVVKRVVSPSGIYKEPELDGYALLAERHNAGWLTLPLLCTSGGIRKWFHVHAPQLLADPLAMCHRLQEVLRGAPANGVLRGQCESTPTHLCWSDHPFSDWVWQAHELALGCKEIC